MTMVDKALDFMYKFHVMNANVTGHYWLLNACLASDRQACATSLIVYAIQEATPWFNSIADGYFGLAPFKGKMVIESGHSNMLE